MSLRKAATIGVALVAAAGLLSTNATPAGASIDDNYSTALLFVPTTSTTMTAWRDGVKTTKAVAPTSRPFAAHLNGYDGGGAYLYNPGSGADSIIRLTHKTGGGVNIAATNAPISGTYTPITGDFDANFVQDILWYAPGSAPDSLWLYNSSGSHKTIPLSINGNYRPTATRTRTTASNTDIIWYGPGSAPDSIWQFDTDGSHTTKALSIGGNYTAIPGEFGEDGTQPKRVIWWNPAGPDYIWLFDDLGDHFSYNLPNVDGSTFQPIVGTFVRNDADAVLWYRPGTASEKLWSFEPGGALDQVDAPAINGTYRWAVGDFDESTYDDIAWTGGGKATLWKFHSGGYSQQVISGLASDVRPVAIPWQFTPDGA